MTRRVIIVSSALLIILYIAVYSGSEENDNTITVRSVGYISIDHSSEEYPKERSPVVFSHDMHVRHAKNGDSVNCRECHTDEKSLFRNYLSYSDFSDKSNRMDGFHGSCIGCHKTSQSENSKKNGPVICSGCHINKPGVKPSHIPAEFKKRLHSRHLNSLDNNCSSCHHVYNSDTGKTEYKKGKEQACSYCHTGETSEKRLGMKDASHQSCLKCHLSRSEKNLPAGPLQCTGCHTVRSSDEDIPTEPVPVLKMNQPDTVVLRSKGETGSSGKLPMVLFDHRNHEIKNESCKGCHHKELTSCNTCHTLNGIEKGAYVTAEEAFHSKTSERSCIGCHEKRKMTSQCAGCHSQMVKSDKSGTCVKCHTVTESTENNITEMKEQRSFTNPLTNKKIKEIPEVVTIKSLEKRYKAVEFPHRKVATSLSSISENNRLAVYFHGNTDYLCSGCHHNVPPSTKPPACSSCHLLNRNASSGDKLSLYGAYHNQCMDCHRAMEIRQPERCSSCHEKPVEKRVISE